MSVFSEHWRACLREHYKSVIRANDSITLRSLVGVMHDAGFREDELRQLQVEATMHIDAVPDDFVPDLTILQPDTSAPADTNDGGEFRPHPLECQCPACVEIHLKPHDADGQPIAVDPEESSPRKSKPAPKQLSMF